MTKEDDLSYPALFTDPRLISLTFISFVATFGSYAAAPALPSIVADLGVSEARVGLVMTAFTLPAIVLLPVIGVLADIYGRRRVLLPSAALFAIAGSAIAFVDSFSAIIVLRIVQGIGGAALIPIAITVLGDIYSGPEGAAAQGIRLSANGVSAILLPAAAGLLAGIAWGYPFLLYAVGVPALLLAYVSIPETARTNEPRTGSIVEYLRKYAYEFRIEVTDRNTAILLLGAFVQGFSYFAILTFGPLFAVQSLGATVFVAGAILSARGIARIVISPSTGLILTRISRRTALVASLVVTAGATALITASPTVLWMAFLLGVFGIGDALFTPVHRDSITDAASDERRAGVVSGMVILRSTGTTVSPVFFGIVLALLGFDYIFVMAAILFAVYALVVLVWFDL